MTVTLFHNPQCSTSRNALAVIRDAGVEPEIVEYKSAGWTKDQLKALADGAGLPVSAFLRRKEALAIELGLTAPDVSEEALLTVMVEHPILVERPIVRSPKGVAIGRPVERVMGVL